MRGRNAPGEIFNNLLRVWQLISRVKMTENGEVKKEKKTRVLYMLYSNL